MRQITPHLWFDKDAKEAVELYTSLIPDSKITSVTTLHDTPSGDSDILSFSLAGQPFMAINAGPVFKINPSVSFFMNFDPSADPAAREHLDKVWQKLADGGKVRMALDTYPFSQRYGWIEDRYGVSWQLILSNPQGERRPFIMPSMMFSKAVAGRAEEAIDFYLSVFKDGKRRTTSRYPKGMEPDKEGTINYADFRILNTWIAAMDSASVDFTFNEAISFIIPCESQQEIDYYWEKLSADPKAEQCGWLKDKYGFSWQVYPTEMSRMMQEGTPEQVNRVTQAFLPMKKFDIAALQRAYEGK